MRLGRITQLHDKPAPNRELGTVLDALRRNEAVMRKQYGNGIVAGVQMTLDHLEGIEAGGVPYKGELPDDLRKWIAGVRAALKDEQR